MVFEPKRDDARVEITLKRYEDGWEIQTPIGPFISWEAIAEKFRKEKLALESEGAEDESYQKGISISEQLIKKITEAARGSS